MSGPCIFDDAHYQRLNETRASRVRELLSELAAGLELKTAADIGCGAGFFSGLLESLGLQVTGVDARQENIEEAHRRVPGASFHVLNAEDSGVLALGRYDLVFCFGLLYHLENPFLTIRHLHRMTSQLALMESIIYPGSEPSMALVTEEFNKAQGVNYFAFYPTEACLVKMLYRAGFRFVYRLARMPDHPDFHATRSVRRIRTILAASHRPLQSTMLDILEEPSTPIRPWDAASGAKSPGLFEKLRRFASKPLPEKAASLRRLLRRREAMP